MQPPPQIDTMMTINANNQPQLHNQPQPQQQLSATCTIQMMTISKSETPPYHQLQTHSQQHQQHNNNNNNNQNNQNHLNQQNQQIQLIQQQQQQQQPTQTNGPKPRGRRKKIRTEPIRPICPQCEKQFSNQSALTKHKLTHSDERKFACQQCSKAFKRHDHLTGHMQTHSNRKPFNCTIQGCDKTYCDARSLRRHKENIHHIVTQQNNNNNNSGNNNLEPSHLLRRRIQRLHSDQGTYNRNVDHLNCVTAPPHSLPSQTLPPQHISNHQVTTPHSNGNNTNNNNNNNNQTINSASGSLIGNHHHHQNQHHHQPYLNHHHHNHHHAPHGSFSADYASTQHFNFDFIPTNNGQDHHHHHHLHHLNSNHQQHVGAQGASLNHGSLEHTLNTGSVPHSADSITDSGLGLNANYEQPTPQPAPISLPPPPPRYTNNQQYLTPNPDHHIHQHQASHGSFSADYASTQHFNFDFVQANNGQDHHHNHLAQGGTTLAHQHHSNLEHTLSTGSVPHSADSITDSGLSLNAHYEQQTATQPQTATLPPPPPRYTTNQSAYLTPNHDQHHHNHHQQAHNGPFSADYASTQHFSFDFIPASATNNQHNHHETQGSALNQHHGVSERVAVCDNAFPCG